MEDNDDDKSFDDCRVYSRTAKILQKNRERVNEEVQRKLQVFLQQNETQTSETEADSDNSVEEVAVLTSSSDIPSRTRSSHSRPVAEDNNTSHRLELKHNIELSEKIRKLEEKRIEQAKLTTDCVVENNNDDDIIDVDELLAQSCYERKLTVKVKKGGDIFRYEMGMNDSFATLYSWLEKTTCVSCDRFSVVMGDRTLRSDETPASVGLSIIHILDFIPLANATPIAAVDNNDKPCIRIYLKAENMRQKMEFLIHKDDTMSKLLEEYATKYNQDVRNLNLHFDGEILDLKSTAADLDLEDDFQLDIVS